MNRISSKRLAKLLKLKTPSNAIKWAKKEGISYFRKGPGYLGRYWFSKKQVLAKLAERSEIVTAKEAINILGICRSTLKRWLKRGDIRPVGKGARNTLLFKKLEVVRFKPKTRFWAPGQKISLAICYHLGLFSDEIAKKLGKSSSAVRSKVAKSGLAKSNFRAFYFLKDVANFFGTNRYRVKRWTKSKKLEAVPLLSSGGRVRYKIFEKDIAKFMALYPKSWQELKPSVNLLELPKYAKLNNPKICKAQ